jgi:hypothetical protein
MIALSRRRAGERPSHAAIRLSTCSAVKYFGSLAKRQEEKGWHSPIEIGPALAAGTEVTQERA